MPFFPSIINIFKLRIGCYSAPLYEEDQTPVLFFAWKVGGSKDFGGGEGEGEGEGVPGGGHENARDLWGIN